MCLSQENGCGVFVDAAAYLFSGGFYEEQKSNRCCCCAGCGHRTDAGPVDGYPPETQEGSKAYTVTVIHKDESVKVFEYRTDAEYLAEALLEQGLVSGEESQYGLTIITVDGEAAVWETDSVYWAIWIGEEMAMTGASEIPVYDGSTFTLEYTRFE